MNKRDLKADREQLKRTIEIFEYQQATLDTPEDEIVPQIDLESQRLYTLIGLGELLIEHGLEWLDRAIEAEVTIRELLIAVDIACRLASDYRMEARYGTVVKGEYTEREQHKLIGDIVYRARGYWGNE